MKKLIPFLAVATLFASCEKEGFDPITFPDAPKEIMVTYTVISNDISADKMQRNVTYISGWKKEDGNGIIPEMTTVSTTGNVTINVSIPSILVPIEGSPGRSHCMVPAGIGWNSTDGKNSISITEIGNEGVMHASWSGSCPSSGHPFTSIELRLFKMF